MKKDIKLKMDKYIFAYGRRKTSIASVRLFEGTGEILVNEKKFEDFFPSKVDRNVIMMPLKKLDLIGKYYFTAKTKGGGIKGSKGAIQLGLAKSLIKVDIDYRKPLKDEGLLTRDNRMVERKHTGFVKARKKPQYSKR